MSEVREDLGPSAAACACYISDEGYLFPSLLSAIQTRRNVTPQQADVVMYFVGRPTVKSEQFKAAYRSFGIRFVDVDPSVIDNTHIMYARLYLERFVEESYTRIVYIDGDTQVCGDLSPLFNVTLPAKTFCAARDPTTIAISYDKSIYPDNAVYFSSIGLTPDQVRLYCNSGVMVFDRSTWIDICADALRLLSTKPTFKFPDQDAINLVTDGRCLTLSFKWNFPIFLMNYGFEDLIKPHILHFMSNPRPWQGPFKPWGRTWHTPYKTLREQCPMLDAHVSDLSTAKQVRYHLQQYYKTIVEGPVWRRPALRQLISQIEGDAFV